MEAELTPLESAINVLEMIKTEFTLTEAVVESSRKLVKEAVRLYFYFFFVLTKIRDRSELIQCLPEVFPPLLYQKSHFSFFLLRYNLRKVHKY